MLVKILGKFSCKKKLLPLLISFIQKVVRSPRREYSHRINISSPIYVYLYVCVYSHTCEILTPAKLPSR